MFFGRMAVRPFPFFNGSGAVYRLFSGGEFQGVGALIAARNPAALHSDRLRKWGSRLRELFVGAGFKEIKTEAYSGFLTMPSLDGYVKGIEAGAGAAGAEFLASRPEVREPVRAELYDLLRESRGEEVQVIVPVMFASGVR